jgi:hypothetical protein
MVLQAWGDPAGQEELAPEPPATGLSFAAVIERARSRGMAAEMALGSLPLLHHLLDAGVPVITAVGEAAWAHYHVIVGYDATRGTLLVQDTDGRRPREVPDPDYLRRWERYAGCWLAAVVPPDRAALLRRLEHTDRVAVSLLARLEAEDPNPEESRALIQAHPEACFSVPLLAHWAVSHLLDDQVEQARAWIERAVARFPHHSWPLMVKAWLLLKEDEPAAPPRRPRPPRRGSRTTGARTPC